jgi:lipopolysaccharide/colanic/teichoic acid biosynthesis glycosyltransferase
MQPASKESQLGRDHPLTDKLSLSFVFGSTMRLGTGLADDFVSGGGSPPVISAPYVNSVWKRLFDLTLSSLLLLLMLPVLSIVALCIKIDSRGPIFFRQEREGRHGSTFNILKFRTMYADAADPTASVQSIRGDLRITRFGALLRRHSIDEVPQLLNVLRGEMSIVGPRPHAFGTTVWGKPLASVTDKYSSRLVVRPGLTGLAQVTNCRGALDSPEKLEARVARDLEYVRRGSLIFDLTIIIRTLRLILHDDTAY